MEVPFDTPKEAKKRFKELQAKYNPHCGDTDFFQNEKNLGKDDEWVAADFRLIGNKIELIVKDATVKNLLTAMKIADLFREV